MDTCQRQPNPTCCLENLTWRDHCQEPSWDIAPGSSQSSTGSTSLGLCGSPLGEHHAGSYLPA